MKATFSFAIRHLLLSFQFKILKIFELSLDARAGFGDRHNDYYIRDHIAITSFTP